MNRVNDNQMTQDETGRSSALARGHGIAAWRQIADGVEAEIVSGLFAPGAQLPTEAALAARFAVNRHTVRRALAALAERGLLRATQGRGTFVEPRPITYPIGPRTRFSEIVSGSGREPGGRLLTSRDEAADAAVAQALGLAIGSPVLRLETLRSADGVPVSYSTAHLPLPRFDGLGDIAGEGLSAAFARYGVGDYRRILTRITARTADSEMARQLELAPGRAVLVVESVNSDAAGIPIQTATAYFAADRVEIVVQT